MIPISIIPRLRSKEAVRYVDRLNKVAGPLLVRKVMDEWVPAVHADIDRQFQVGGDPRWKLNKPSTIAGKGHSKVLFGRGGRSGIQDSINVFVAVMGSHGASVFASDGTSYGQYHQEGGSGPWLIPADPNHPTYRFPIGDKWVTIARGRQIRHPGFPRRSFIVVGIKLTRILSGIVWKELKQATA